MRISDWSSDVCSSDLCDSACAALGTRARLSYIRTGQRVGRSPARRKRRAGGKSGLHGNTVPGNARRGRPQGKCHRKQTAVASARQGRKGAVRAHRGSGNGNGTANPNGRSEEHTSELQSLMRISSAVFCLKKKKNT